MAKVLSPNPQYNGESASVHFKNGEGECSDEHLLSWFREKGYTVIEEPTVPVSTETGEKADKKPKAEKQPKASKTEPPKGPAGEPTGEPTGQPNGEPTGEQKAEGSDKE